MNVDVMQLLGELRPIDAGRTEGLFPAQQRADLLSAILTGDQPRGAAHEHSSPRWLRNPPNGPLADEPPPVDLRAAVRQNSPTSSGAQLPKPPRRPRLNFGTVVGILGATLALAIAIVALTSLHHGAAQTTAIGDSGAHRSGTHTGSLPGLSTSAITQLGRHGIDVTREPPANGGSKGISAQTAIKTASRALGLSPASAVAASQGSLTTPGMGKTGSSGTVTSPEYSSEPVWAIQFADVKFPERGPAGGPTSYTADLVAFVNLSSGTWLFASQYDPPTSANPPTS